MHYTNTNHNPILLNIVVDAANIPQMPAGTKCNQSAAYRSQYYCK